MVSFKRTGSNFESLTVNEILSNNFASHRENVYKRELINVTNFIVVLCQEIVTATSVFNNHHSDQSAAININARPTKWLWLAESSDDG